MRKYQVSFLYLLLLLISTVVSSQQASDDVEDYGRSLVPNALMPFYKDYILEFHYHVGTPEVLSAQCWNYEFIGCIVFWLEPLPSSSEHYMSIVKPNASESFIHILLRDDTFPLGYQVTHGTLVITLLNETFEDGQLSSQVEIMQIIDDEIVSFSQEPVFKKHSVPDINH